ALGPDSNLAPIAGTNNVQWLLTYPSPLQQLGTFTLQIGPDVRDVMGNPGMNQNGDGTFGTAGDAPAGDRFSAGIVIQGLVVNSITATNPLLGANGSATITFNEGVNPNTFKLNQGDVQLLDPNGNPIALTDGNGNALPGVALNPKPGTGDT